jgi:hypothetical protein
MLMESRISKRPTFWWVVSGLLALLAFLFRYIGLVMLPVFLWEGVRVWRAKGIGAASKAATMSIVGLLAGIVILFGRNVAITGNLRGLGKDEVLVQGHFLLSSWKMVSILCGSFGIWSKTRAVLLGTVLVSIILGYCLRVYRVRRTFADKFKGHLDLILVGGACYFLLIAYALRFIADTSYQFEPRYAAPLLPMALIIVYYGLFVCSDQTVPVTPSTLGRFVQNVPKMAGVLFVGFVGYQFAQVNAMQWSTEKDQNILSTPVCEWLRSNCPAGTRFASNKGIEIAFFGDCPCLYLPHRSPNPLIRIPGDMESRLPTAMVQDRCQYLVLLADRGGLPEECWGNFVSDLSRRKVKTKRLKMVFEDETAVVYRIRN